MIIGLFQSCELSFDIISLYPCISSHFMELCYISAFENSVTIITLPLKQGTELLKNPFYQF